MTRRTAILHIGSPKTGTTSIQRTLADNRAALPPLGFAYPEAPGPISHVALAAYMDDVDASGSGRIQLLAGPVTDLPERLARELAALPDAVHTVVFSNEHVFNRGVEPGAVARLRAMLDGMFDRYRVVAYLRRQDELAVSLLSTRLKAGRTQLDPFPTGERRRAAFDYGRCLAPWIEAFGRDAVTLRIFARDELAGGDVVTDFLGLCGLPALPQAPPEANTSLVPAAQEFLRLLNEASTAADPAAVAADDAGPAWRPPTYLRAFLTGHFGGRGSMPTAAAARAFLDSFAASNEALRAGFFPDRAQLFPGGFERYPATESVPTDSEILRVALEVARMQTETIAELRAARWMEAAEKAQTEGRREDMIGAYLKALEFRPQHEPALRDLMRAVETPAEARIVRQFLAASPYPAAVKAAHEAALAARFGGRPIPSRRDAAARRAERRG